MFNEIYIKIEGLNLFRVSEKLISSGVMMSNFKMKNSYMVFSINAKYLPKLKEILKREKKNFFILKNTPIKRFFVKIPYCIGTFLAFCMLFAFFWYYDNMIFDINLSCAKNENYDLLKVENVLYNHNITVGSKLSKEDSKNLESLLLQNLSDLSGCEIFFKGKTLNIIVYKMIEKPQDFKEDLLSKYNAIITRVETSLGESIVKEGDLVLEGDVLIKNKGGAAGKVMGKVYFSSTRVYNEKQTKFIETGKVFEVEDVNIFNLFNKNLNSICEFDEYKIEKVSKPLLKNLFIPIYKEKYSFKELVCEDFVCEFETVEQQIKDELKQEVLKKIPKDVEAQNISYSIVREGTMVRIDCFAEVEINLI